MSFVPPESDAGCPFVNANDQRCGQRFTLGCLQQTMAVCFGADHVRCPIHHQLAREPERIESTPREIQITIHGDSLAAFHQHTGNGIVGRLGDTTGGRSAVRGRIFPATAKPAQAS